MKYLTIPTSNDYQVWYDKDYYIDKTGELLKLEGTLERGSAIFFARPRRWGKSLFFSMTNYFLNKDLYKKEYFEGKIITQSEKLLKKAGRYFVISLDLKPIYNKDDNSLKWDLLWVNTLKQLPDDIFEKIFKEEKPFFDNGYFNLIEKFISNGKNLGEFLKSFIETYSKETEILLLIDEYDKPVNDCLKYKKNELNCKLEVLEELKDKLYKYLKDIPCITMITGINKLSMSSFFSDFNNLKDYSKKITLGYTQDEVEKIFNRLEVKYTNNVKKWYNGYKFNETVEYNPWAINTFLESENGEFSAYWSKTGTAPDYFRYLVTDILKVKTFKEFLNILKDYKYTDKVISLETINELNIPVILHYFYYSGLLTITEDLSFAVPNNDVIFAYEDLIFPYTETETYLNLRNIATDALELLHKDTNYLKEFIEFLLKEKYINNDKRDLNKIGEQIITSDIALIYKTFARLDLRREVNILEGRTDLEYIDFDNNHILYELKILTKDKKQETTRQEAIKQIKNYGDKYNKKYIIMIDLEKIEVFVEEVS